MSNYERNGKTIDITWGDKISESLKKRYAKGFDRTCQHCKKNFKAKREMTKWCSRECRHAAKYTNVTGVEKKAIIIGANLLMGQGKKATIIEMIEDALGNPCTYCDEELTLDNITMDHIVPYESSVSRRNKAKNKELRKKMDRRENLQIICKTCNQRKFTFDEKEFRGLLAFLDTVPDLKEKLFKRLEFGKLAWRRGARRK